MCSYTFSKTYIIIIHIEIQYLDKDININNKMIFLLTKKKYITLFNIDIFIIYQIVEIFVGTPKKLYSIIR